MMNEKQYVGLMVILFANIMYFGRRGKAKSKLEKR